MNSESMARNEQISPVSAGGRYALGTGDLVWCPSELELPIGLLTL